MATDKKKKTNENLFDSQTFQKEIKDAVEIVNKERTQHLKALLIQTKDAMLKHLSGIIKHQLAANGKRLALQLPNASKRFELCTIDNINTTLTNEELKYVETVLNEAKEISVYISAWDDELGDCTMLFCKVACNLS
jgi:hypothetical protein